MKKISFSKAVISTALLLSIYVNVNAQNTSFFNTIKCSIITCSDTKIVNQNNANGNFETPVVTGWQFPEFNLSGFREIFFGNKLSEPTNVNLPAYTNVNANISDIKTNANSGITAGDILNNPNSKTDTANISKPEGCLMSAYICNTLLKEGIIFDKNGPISKTNTAQTNTGTVCKAGDTACEKRLADEKKMEDSLVKVDPNKTDNGQSVGSASPNYDSHEPGVVGEYGPEQPGYESKVTDSQISSQAKSFDGKGVFVNPGTGSCSGWGMTVGGSCPDANSYLPNFKLATSRFCALTGKKTVITSGNRSSSCNARVGGASGSAHMSGLAMDISFSNLNENEKVIAYLYYVAQGFNNLGGYGANKAVHMDMRNSSNRWGTDYTIKSCKSGLYPDYARTAFSLMGLNPCDRDSSAPSRAKAALQKIGKPDFAIPATESALSS